MWNARWTAQISNILSEQWADLTGDGSTGWLQDPSPLLWIGLGIFALQRATSDQQLCFTIGALSYVAGT